MANRPIWIRNEEGIKILHPTLPNCWHGEADCVVGPFSSKVIAEYFAKVSTDFSHCNAIMDSIFPNGDAWYVEVKPVEA